MPEAYRSEASMTTDEQLLARFVRGERAALGTLAERHERNLVGLATGLLDGRVDLAQDAVQESWLRVIRYAKSFEGKSSFRTWVYRVVINRCREIREKGVSGQALIAAVPERETPLSENPLRLTVAEAGLSEVRAGLRGLNPSARLLVLLCYHRGLTHSEAADVMDIPIGTLKSRLNAALNELRGLLGDSDTKAGAI